MNFFQVCIIIVLVFDICMVHKINKCENKMKATCSYTAFILYLCRASVHTYSLLFDQRKTIKSKIQILIKVCNRTLPRSNMHGRKRPFTLKNRDIRRSYTGSVHEHRIRSETVRNGYRIRRSYENME
jgi:hypothetical protein